MGFFKSIGPCVVGIEACASAHHWARELMEIDTSCVIPPAYVKADVKHAKTAAADALAIAEVVIRPMMRLVALTSKAQQALLMLHKTRDLLVRQKTMVINALRGHLGEFGIVAPQGPAGCRRLLGLFGQRNKICPIWRVPRWEALADQLDNLSAKIGRLERRILEWHRQDETSRCLATIPGIWPITTSAMAASAPDPTLFKSGRQLAAWLGLTPRANSSGGKDRQDGISKIGDSYLRRLLVVGATAVLRMARQRGRERWVGNLRERKKPKVAAVALANMTTRIA